MKKIKIYSEIIYVLAIIILSLAVAMITTTNFGVSMIVAPAYILSLKFEALSFGQCEYIVQGILILIYCIIVRKIKPIFFTSFLTGIIYGMVLDLWRYLVPHFNPAVTPPGSLPIQLNIVYFIIGMLLTSLSVSMFFRTYLLPQVYDFFVKGVSEKYGFDRNKFKTAYDISFMLISCILSLILFKKLVGVGCGTVIMAFCNGTIIGFFGKLTDKYISVEPYFKKSSDFFAIT